MKHISYTDVEGRKVEEAGAHGVTIRTVIGEPDGAPNFSMRVISFEKEGATPNHSHPWEHEVFILKGKRPRGSQRQNGPTQAGGRGVHSRRLSALFSERRSHGDVMNDPKAITASG